MRKVVRGFLMLGFCLIVAPRPTAAQEVVYTVPGVVNDGALGTFFTCSAFDDQSVTVTVFNATGNAAGTATLSVSANTSVTIGTTSADGISPDANTDSPDANTDSPTIAKGYGQVSSTSPKLICSAMVADLSSAPPVSLTSLPVQKRTSSEGN